MPNVVFVDSAWLKRRFGLIVNDNLCHAAARLVIVGQFLSHQ